MQRALEVARRGLGTVSPNPPVGAVAVREGAVIGEGWHARYGGPHAERDLIARVTETHGVEACRGADLYVTLEPCAHHGKTPPCTDAVIAAGFARVLVGCDDPNPQTSAIGYAKLAEAGIPVVRGVEEDAARALIAGYLCRRNEGRALATAKWAMTADGRIAAYTGDARWISADATRTETRAERSTFDAILVGRGTVAADDPALTARTPDRPDPIRVVLDSTFRIDPASTLVRTAREVPLVVIGSEGDAGNPEIAARRAALEAAGVTVRSVATEDEGRPDPREVLRLLGGLEIEDPAIGVRGIATVLVEGGAEVHGAFLAADCIDRAQVIIAPKLIGGSAAPGPIGGHGIARMADARPILDARWHPLGADQVLEGALTPAGRGRPA